MSLDSYFTHAELRATGFDPVGNNVKISRKCSFYNIKGSIGNHTRIDDFCILKGQVTLGSYVHLAAYCMISGAHKPVVIEDFVGIASRLSLFSGSDDYSADTLGNPTVPTEYTTQIEGPVTVGFGTMIGAHVVVLPNLRIGAAASIGAGCIVHKDVPDGGILRAAASRLIPDKKRDVQRVKELGVRILSNDAGEV